MGVTAVKLIVNSTNEWLYIQNHENPDKSRHFIVLPPGTSGNVDMWIPWCANPTDFQAGHFIEIGNWADAGNVLNPIREYIIWQHDRGTWFGKDGDHVRFSTDGQWHDRFGALA